MAYDYVLDDESFEFIGNRVRWQVLQNFSESTRDFWSLTFDMPHYLDPTFAPATVNNEILEVAAKWYSRRQKRPFVLAQKELETFGETRALGMDVPAYKFFRDIKAVLWVRDMLADWKFQNQRVVSDIATPEWIAYVREILLSIPVRADRVLTVQLEPEHVSERDREVFAEAIEEVDGRGFREVEHVMWPQRLYTGEMWVQAAGKRVKREKGIPTLRITETFGWRRDMTEGMRG